MLLTHRFSHQTYITHRCSLLDSMTVLKISLKDIVHVSYWHTALIKVNDMTLHILPPLTTINELLLKRLFIQNMKVNYQKSICLVWPIFRHYPGTRFRKTTKFLGQYRQQVCRDLNRIITEYNSTVLPLDEAAQGQRNNVRVTLRIKYHAMKTY